MARRLLLILVLLGSCLNIAFAGQQQTTYIALIDSGSGGASAAIYVPRLEEDLGVNPGVFVHEGTVARFVCTELVETQEGLSTFYARATILNSGHRWYLKIVDLPEGLGSAMAGFLVTDGDLSPDHCGAAGLPTHPVTSLKISLPDGN